MYEASPRRVFPACREAARAEADEDGNAARATDRGWPSASSSASPALPSVTPPLSTKLTDASSREATLIQATDEPCSEPRGPVGPRDRTRVRGSPSSIYLLSAEEKPLDMV